MMKMSFGAVLFLFITLYHNLIGIEGGHGCDVSISSSSSSSPIRWENPCTCDECGWSKKQYMRGLVQKLSNLNLFQSKSSVKKKKITEELGRLKFEGQKGKNKVYSSSDSDSDSDSLESHDTNCHNRRWRELMRSKSDDFIYGNNCPGLACKREKDYRRSSTGKLTRHTGSSKSSGSTLWKSAKSFLVGESSGSKHRRHSRSSTSGSYRTDLWSFPGSLNPGPSKRSHGYYSDSMKSGVTKMNHNVYKGMREGSIGAYQSRAGSSQYLDSEHPKPRRRHKSNRHLDRSISSDSYYTAGSTSRPSSSRRHARTRDGSSHCHGSQCPNRRHKSDKGSKGAWWNIFH